MPRQVLVRRAILEAFDPGAFQPGAFQIAGGSDGLPEPVDQPVAPEEEIIDAT